MLRRVNRCINKQLQDLCERVIHIDELNLKLSHYLTPILSGHCRVGSFNKGCLVITTSNPAFATELRYYAPTLRDRLRTEGGLYQLISIKIQIMPEEYPKDRSTSENTSKLKMSPAAKEAVRNAGELCSYPPLKQILFQLAGNLE